MSDIATFFAGFMTVFGALAWYLWHLEKKIAALQRRLDDMEAA